MPGFRKPPEQDKQIAALAQRVKNLERLLIPGNETRALPALFTFSGFLVEDIESPKWRPNYGVTLTLLTVDLITAGSGAVIIELKLSGSLARTLTVPSGETFTEDAVPLSIPRGKYLTATVTQASSAEDLSIAASASFM